LGGCRSTGDEDFIKVSYFADTHILDPDSPESLVYEPRPDGSKKLAAATFTLNPARGSRNPGVDSPMIHVWIEPHPWGPAALESVGAGQIKPGEERLCDHAHGA
jgi:hypothetical protein